MKGKMEKGGSWGFQIWVPATPLFEIHPQILKMDGVSLSHNLKALVSTRPATRQALSGKGGIHFLRGLGRQTSSANRSHCATSADKTQVAHLVETSIFLTSLETLTESIGSSGESRLGGRRRRNRRRSRDRRRERDQSTCDLLMELAMENILRPRVVPRPLTFVASHPRCINDYSDRFLWKCFHLNRSELTRLVNSFDFPEVIRTTTRRKWPKETGTLFFSRWQVWFGVLLKK